MALKTYGETAVPAHWTGHWKGTWTELEIASTATTRLSAIFWLMLNSREGLDLLTISAICTLAVHEAVLRIIQVYIPLKCLKPRQNLHTNIKILIHKKRTLTQILLRSKQGRTLELKGAPALYPLHFRISQLRPSPRRHFLRDAHSCHPDFSVELLRTAEALIPTLKS